MSLITPKVGLKEVSKGELVGFENRKIGHVRPEYVGKPKFWKLKPLLLKHEINYLVRNT